MNPLPARIAFVCTGNAGRSQIAAALARRALGDAVDIVSAGVEPWDNLHAMTRPTLARRNVQLHNERPKPVSAVCDRAIALVVTIGDPAKARLPRALPGGPLWIHWDISDPADADGTPDSADAFERAALQIEQHLPAVLEQVQTLVSPADPSEAPIRRLR